MHVRVIYSWPRLWSMGPGRGSPDFSLSLRALARAFDRVTVVFPAGEQERFRRDLPEGVEAVSFRWVGRGLKVPVPGLLRDRSRPAVRAARALLFAVNWVLRIISYAGFTVAAYRAATGKRFGGEPPEIVAAYGYMAVPAARLAARSTGARMVTRLFGVSLGMKGFSLPALAAQFEESLSFLIRAERWVITNDGSRGDLAASRLGVPPERVVFLINGVDRGRGQRSFDRGQYRRRLGLAPETAVVLRVCRLWPQQRVDRLIEQMPARLEDGTPVAAVIAGEGSERGFLEQLAAGHGKTVVFTGALSHAELDEHYACADLFAATSDRTNLSNSVLEALEHGLPVVALDFGGTSDVVRDRVNGRLVDPGRPEELGRALGEILSDSALRERLSRGAGETARELIPDYESRMDREAAAVGLYEMQPDAKETGDVARQG